MKFFEEPVILVEQIEVEDVITTSLTPGVGDGNFGGEIFD